MAMHSQPPEAQILRQLCDVHSIQGSLIKVPKFANTLWEDVHLSMFACVLVAVLMGKQM